MESFLAHLRTLDQLLDESSAFDWRRLRMPSPVVSLPLRFNLGDVYSILVVHAERHARQIERVVAETSGITSSRRSADHSTSLRSLG